MVAMDPCVMNKPLLDLTSEEILQLPQKHARKAMHILVPEVFKTRAASPWPKHAVEYRQSWWVGDFKKNKPSNVILDPILIFLIIDVRGAAVWLEGAWRGLVENDRK